MTLRTSGPLQRPGREQALVALGLGLALASVLGLALPGSVFEYPHAFLEEDALTAIYSGRDGQVLFTATVAVLVALFLGAVYLAGAITGPRLHRPVLVIAVLLAFVYVPVYPSGSADLTRNIFDARTLWIHGQNPQSVGPQARRDDPIYPHLVQAHQTGRGYYGPVSYVLNGPPTLLAGDGLLANMLAFKAWSALILCGLVAVAGRAARMIDPKRSVQAMVLAGWNPLVLYEGVANAHNDLAMAALFTGACFLALRAPVAGVGVWGLSAGVKFATALVAPAFLWWLWLRRSRLLAVAALGAGLAAMLFFTAGRPATSFGIFVEFPVFRTLYSAIYYATEDSLGRDAVYLARYTSMALFGVLMVVTLRLMDSSPKSLFRACFWLLFGAATLMVSYFWPWYYLWFIPIGAVLAGSTEARVAALVSVAGLAFYVWFPFSEPTIELNYLMVGLLLVIPAGYALLEVVSSRPRAAELEAPGRGDAPD